MPQIRLTIRHALALAALLGTAPALAQGTPGQEPSGQGASSQAAPAAPARSITSSGQTMPRPKQTAGAPAPRPASDAEMVKAQKASEARSKTWDDKMHRTMGSICHGC
jgi:hypothetical protein